MNKNTGKLVDISPLAPLKITLETTNDDLKNEYVESILFLDQSEGKIYNLEGPVSEDLRKAIFSFLKRKQEEVQREMNSALLKATPEELMAMGIDPKEFRKNNQNSGLII